MKKTLLFLTLGTMLSLGAMKACAQGMAVNTSGASANSSAILDVSSTTQGMLIPRMTNAQITLISSPATGLLVYQTDGTAGFYFYNGSSWISLNTPGGTAGGDLTGSYPNPTISSSGSTGDDIVTAVNASSGGLSGTKLATTSVSVNAMSATGTRNSTTYLRGDNTWATVSGGSGTVTSVSSGVLTSGTTAFTDTIFSTTVSTPTTTPSINYTFTNACAYCVLTNTANSPVKPTYTKVNPLGLYASTGVASATTYYRGDGAWATPSSGSTFGSIGTGTTVGNSSGTATAISGADQIFYFIQPTTGSGYMTLPNIATNGFAKGYTIYIYPTTKGTAFAVGPASGNTIYTNGGAIGSGSFYTGIADFAVFICDGSTGWYGVEIY